MAIVVAFANHKGGVGKTASVAALGTAFANAGYRVLMVDLDTQANLTYQFIGVDEKKQPERFIYNAIRERKNLPQVALKENLYICPSGLEMTLVETEMYNMRLREFVLQDLIRPLDDKYDFILLDCPPSLGIMTTNALIFADRVVVPMKADLPSYYGLKMMAAFVESLSDINRNLAINDIFFNFYDQQLRLTRSSEAQIREEYGDAVMKSAVRRNVKVSEAYADLKSVIDSNPESAGARDYLAVSKELLGRICGNVI